MLKAMPVCKLHRHGLLHCYSSIIAVRKLNLSLYPNNLPIKNQPVTILLVSGWLIVPGISAFLLLGNFLHRILTMLQMLTHKPVHCLPIRMRVHFYSFPVAGSFNNELFLLTSRSIIHIIQHLKRHECILIPMDE